MKPIVEKDIDYIIDQFYKTVLGVDKLQAIILEHSSIAECIYHRHLQ
ncbi:hypothetical protein [Paenibacillus graminis]|nr:hypothetical protein [Paenibacillus graminis]